MCLYLSIRVQTPCPLTLRHTHTDCLYLNLSRTPLSHLRHPQPSNGTFLCTPTTLAPAHTETRSHHSAGAHTVLPSPAPRDLFPPNQGQQSSLSHSAPALQPQACGQLGGFSPSFPRPGFLSCPRPGGGKGGGGLRAGLLTFKRPQQGEVASPFWSSGPLAGEKSYLLSSPHPCCSNTSKCWSFL